jgi:hypothetical protein
MTGDDHVEKLARILHDTQCGCGLGAEKNAGAVNYMTPALAVLAAIDADPAAYGYAPKAELDAALDELRTEFGGESSQHLRPMVQP